MAIVFDHLSNSVRVFLDGSLLGEHSFSQNDAVANMDCPTDENRCTVQQMQTHTCISISGGVCSACTIKKRVHEPQDPAFVAATLRWGTVHLGRAKEP